MKYKIIIFSVLMGLFNGFGFAQNAIDKAIEKYNSNSVEYISVPELASLMQKNKDFKLLDTRAVSEYEVSHLKDAIYVGYKEFDLESIQDKIKPDDTIIMYCSFGVRSEQIGEQLQEAGYKKVYNLYGGLFEWFNQGNEIFNLQNQQTDSIHAYNNKWGQFIKGGTKVYE